MSARSPRNVTVANRGAPSAGMGKYADRTWVPVRRRASVSVQACLYVSLSRGKERVREGT